MKLNANFIVIYEISKLFFFSQIISAISKTEDIKNYLDINFLIKVLIN